MCNLALEYFHVFSWGCACFDLSLCLVSLAHACFLLSMCLLAVVHVHLQLCMCTLAFEQVHAWQLQVHTCIWASACLLLSMCTLSLEDMHTFTWACAWFQLSICKLAVEHVDACSWEGAHLQFEHSMQACGLHKCDSVPCIMWHLILIFNLKHSTDEFCMMNIQMNDFSLIVLWFWCCHSGSVLLHVKIVFCLATLNRSTQVWSTHQHAYCVALLDHIHAADLILFYALHYWHPHVHLGCFYANWCHYCFECLHLVVLNICLSIFNLQLSISLEHMYFFFQLQNKWFKKCHRLCR